MNNLKLLRFASLSTLGAALALCLTIFKASANSEVEGRIAQIYDDFGVKVHYIADRHAYFPSTWLRPPASGSVAQASTPETLRMLKQVPRFLAHYPTAVIKQNLKNIFLAKDYVFYGKSFGATNSRDGLYLKSRGVSKGFTDTFLLVTLHSEFSSILLRNNRIKFPYVEWKAINPSDFNYVGSGVDMLGQGNLYGSSRKLRSRGFIVKYAKASVEDDVNMLVKSWFESPRKLKRYASQSRRIAKKMVLLREFYQAVHSDLDLE